MPTPIIILLIFCLSALPRSRAGCHSCFTSCHGSQMENCDCQSNSSDTHCHSRYCFAKIETFSSDSQSDSEFSGIPNWTLPLPTASFFFLFYHLFLVKTVHKGCASDIPGGEAGCHYASVKDSVYCYCQGNECNTKAALNDFAPKSLPRVSCCKCNEEEERCDKDSCREDAPKCEGGYCFHSFLNHEQGCGEGYPQIQNFLRTPNVSSYLGSTTCAEYEAGHHIRVDGCSCSERTGRCNIPGRLRAWRQRERYRATPDRELPRCYKLYKKSDDGVKAKSFRGARTCRGEFCFVSLTSQQVALDDYYGDEAEDYYSDEGEDYNPNEESIRSATLVSEHELLAGCIHVDNAEKVREGCSAEWRAGDWRAPVLLHCVCRGNLCNSYRFMRNATAAAIERARSERSSTDESFPVGERSPGDDGSSGWERSSTGERSSGGYKTETDPENEINDGITESADTGGSDVDELQSDNVLPVKSAKLLGACVPLILVAVLLSGR